MNCECDLDIIKGEESWFGTHSCPNHALRTLYKRVKHFLVLFLSISACAPPGVYCHRENEPNKPISCAKDGLPGKDATLGPATPVSTITPCGPNSSPYKEVLLCLNNGSLLATVSNNVNGDYTRLSLVGAGTFYDTDNSGCQFTVSAGVNNSSIVSWSANAPNWVAGSVVCKNNIWLEG